MASVRPWRLFGIPIHLDASWLVVATLISWSLASRYFPLQYPGVAPWLYWVMGASAAVLLFACILLHELGHSLVAQRHGLPVACVTLFMFGGVSQIADEPARPAVEFKVALAGPAVSLLIAAACLLAVASMPLETAGHLVVAALLRYLGTINVVLAVFNLLPGFPLDGGRILRAALWAWTGSLRRATRASSLLGGAFGLGLLAFGIWAAVQGSWVAGLWYVFLGLFLRSAALASYRRAG